KKAVDDKQTAGVAIAAARAGGVVYDRAFGDATPSTRFRFASVSKMITAVAALRLVEDGKLDLDAPIAPFLDGKLAGMTVGQLLSHTSGLADFREAVEAGARSPADVVAKVDAQPRAAPPGAELRYANVNFYLLGLVVAKASGRPLAETIGRLVL